MANRTPFGPEANSQIIEFCDASLESIEGLDCIELQRFSPAARAKIFRVIARCFELWAAGEETRGT